MGDATQVAYLLEENGRAAYLPGGAHPYLQGERGRRRTNRAPGPTPWIDGVLQARIQD